jgi:hypothetical protein
MAVIPALLLGGVALACADTSAHQTVPNLDFSTGQLTHWTGEGFYITPASGHGPSARAGVCSSDRGSKGRKALLHRTFTIPAGALYLRFRAGYVRPGNLRKAPDGAKTHLLEVFLEAPRREFLPRQIRTPQGLVVAPTLAPWKKERVQEYVWDVSGHSGERVRIALVDDDDRPGCYLVCTGFRFENALELQRKTFARFMQQLCQEHHLAPAQRQETRHFLAYSNADDQFTRHQLLRCETCYSLFFDHFRSKGFSLRPPAGKLMVALFGSEEGLEAYIEQRSHPALTGLYHTPSNRLVVYDYARNRSFQAARNRFQDQIGRLPSPREAQQVGAALRLHAWDRRTTANTSTVMHEVAHLISFNCGLLNRHGDVPVWLAEGLACYCESTIDGTWQGIGQPNPMRTRTLERGLKGKGLLSLRDLIRDDDWLRQAPDIEQILLGYAQSWALFRMLMDQEPRALQGYLAQVRAARTPDQRLADFVESFGSLKALEARYHVFVRGLVQREKRPGR